MTTTDELEHRNARLLASALARIEALEVVYGKRLEAHVDRIEALTQRVDALAVRVENLADQYEEDRSDWIGRLEELETRTTDLARRSAVIGVSPVRR